MVSLTSSATLERGGCTYGLLAKRQGSLDHRRIEERVGNVHVVRDDRRRLGRHYPRPNHTPRTNVACTRNQVQPRRVVGSERDVRLFLPSLVLACSICGYLVECAETLSSTANNATVATIPVTTTSHTLFLRIARGRGRGRASNSEGERELYRIGGGAERQPKALCTFRVSHSTRDICPISQTNVISQPALLSRTDCAVVGGTIASVCG